LNGEQALIYPEAFSVDSFEMMYEKLELFAVPEEEARNFACNAVILGDQAIIPSRCPDTKACLESLDFQVWECDMSEFIKAGGACKCLTIQC
jgi:N-dimethylarginine dimethylaminohydrolase